MKFLLTSIVVFFLWVPIVAQKLDNQVSLTVEMTRLDYFSGIRYAKQINRWQFAGGVALGMNKTFFAGRIFPEFTLQTSFFLIQHDKFLLGPFMSYSWLFYTLNKADRHLTYWQAPQIGCRLEWGKRIRWTFDAAGGWMREQYYDVVSENKNYAGSLAWSVKSGIAYAW